MKTFLLTFLSSLLCLSLFGQQTNKSVVVYYSRSGNTEAVAKQIQLLTGADLKRIDVANDYPEEYQATVDIARAEKEQNARPALKEALTDLSDYDTLYVGFPIWCGSYPMVIATFLESQCWEGKTLIPFCTHGSGGVDQGFVDLIRLTPSATHRSGLALSGNEVAESQEAIRVWLTELGLIE